MFVFLLWLTENLLSGRESNLQTGHLHLQESNVFWSIRVGREEDSSQALNNERTTFLSKYL
jgi:hypothetical protein